MPSPKLEPLTWPGDDSPCPLERACRRMDRAPALRDLAPSSAGLAFGHRSRTPSNGRAVCQLGSTSAGSCGKPGVHLVPHVRSCHDERRRLRPRAHTRFPTTRSGCKLSRLMERVEGSACPLTRRPGMERQPHARSARTLDADHHQLPWLRHRLLHPRGPHRGRGGRWSSSDVRRDRYRRDPRRHRLLRVAPETRVRWRAAVRVISARAGGPSCRAACT